MEFIQGEEEFWAERIMVEERRNQEEAEQIMEMRARLAEKHFLYYFSQETQQQARMWENAERAFYQTQCRNFEHRMYQEAAQEKLTVEAAADNKHRQAPFPPNVQGADPWAQSLQNRKKTQ